MAYYLNCEKCGMSLQILTEAGRYLERTSPKGTEFRGQCVPACNVSPGNGDTALVAPCIAATKARRERSLP